DQRPEPAHAADRDRALPGPALDELGARVRRVDDRDRPGDRDLRHLPAPVRQRHRVRGAEGLMAASTDLRRVDDPLVLRSIEVLKAGQAASGAFVASPSFTVYRYAWLRDGAFCAHALDVVGETAAAAAWHAWVARSVEAHRGLIE